MIYFNFRLSNPFARDCEDFNNTKTLFGKLTKNKVWEIESHKNSETIINFGIDLSFRRSHAGICIWGGLLGYCFSFEIYDRRHYNYKDNCWEVYEDEE